MSRHQKELTKKQKISIYISCAIAAVIAAVGAVVLVVHLVKNPPAVIFNSNSASYISNLSDLVGSSGIVVPDATITIIDDSQNEKVDDIVVIADAVKASNKNKIIVKTDPIDTSGLSKRQVKIPLKHISQNPELPTGCEITSLTAILNYYGYDVSKTEMSDEYLEKTMNKVGNFWEVFVGNPRKNGFGCYAKPIVNAANRYLATQNNKHKATDFSGTKFEDLLKFVENGTPVIIWSTMYGEEENNLREPYVTVQWNVNGKDIQWIAPEHCMVIIGYDLDRNIAIVCDPQRNIVEYNLQTLKERYLALHSQCVVLEKIPVIKGVQNEATYYTTQYVTAIDDNITTVTVNGKESEKGFFINGNSDETYVIKATDNDGITTTITIYTKSISSLSEPIRNLNSYNVTAEHRTKVETVKNIALNLDTRYSPPSESKAINEILTICDTLLTKIASVESEIEHITKTAKKFENKAIVADDNTMLSSLIDSIDSLIATSNLTATQQSMLAEIKQKCNDWLSVLRDTDNNTYLQQ